MAADLHIHISSSEDVSRHVREYLKKEFTSYSKEGAFKGYRLYRLAGSDNWLGESEVPWEDESIQIQETRDIHLDFDEDVVYNTPQVWVGEVSWLKAGLTGDRGTYVPDVVGAVQEALPGLVLIDGDLISKIESAFSKGNSTAYSVADAVKVLDFLRANSGKFAFAVSH